MFSDPRGPERSIVSVTRRTDGVSLLLTCGHTRDANQIYSYRVGGRFRCMMCIPVAADDRCVTTGECSCPVGACSKGVYR